MGHETGRPAPAAITPDPTRTPTVAIDPRWGAVSDQMSDEPDEALVCPGCGVGLLGVDDFETFRVCSGCDRHFPLPALERLDLLVDADTFLETNGVLVSVEPLIFRDLLPFPERAAAIPEQTRVGPGGGLGEAVITGTGAIGGHQVVLLVLDHTYLGGNIGPVAAEKVVLAMELATARRLPLVALCAASYPGYPTGDEGRMRAGLLSLAQWPKIAAAAARLHSAAVPMIAVLAHPTTGGVYAGLGGQADIMLAEPGAQIGLSAGGRGYPAAAMTTAEDLLAGGQIDAVVDRRQVQATIATLLGLFADRGGFVPSPAGEPVPPTSQPPFWEQIALATHPARPTGRDFVPWLTSEFVELHGDRIGADDAGMTCGLGRLGGRPVAIIAQNRPRPTLALAPGGPSADGWRQAIRLLRLAGHLELPVITLVDTAGGAERDPGDGGADSRVGTAIAELLRLSSLLPVPIVSAIIGQGYGLGAMALGAGDRRLMLQHAVMSAEMTTGSGPLPAAGPAAAQPSSLPPGAPAGRSRPVTATECERLGLVDTIVAEPSPAAHVDPEAAARLLGLALARTLAELTGHGSRRLLEERARRLRSLGAATPEGREAARREIRELHELQRSLSRSLGDLRGRWGARSRSLPHLPRPRLPAVSSLPRPRPGQIDRSRLTTRVRPELVDLAGRIADGVRTRGHGGRDQPAPDDEPLTAPRPDSLN